MPASSTRPASIVLGDCGAGDPQTIGALRQAQPPRAAFERAADLFRLVGDPTRLALLRALADAGELCVCDLATVADVGENTVSQALRLLRAADVVRSRREGRRIHYRLADGHVHALVQMALDHVDHVEQG